MGNGSQSHRANEKAGPTTSTRCRAKIDRVVLASPVDLRNAVTRLGDFRTVSDYEILGHENPFAAYGRVRKMVDDKTGTRLFIDYKPIRNGLARVRASIVPDDRTGLGRAELQTVFDALEPCAIRIVEVALDFADPTSVDAAFVRRTCKFGKSRLRPNKRFPHAAWLGAPKSQAFVRAYPKPEVGGFRVEIQFNREALSQHMVQAPNDFPKLSPAISEKLGFFDFNWHALRRFATKHLRHSGRILELAEKRRGELSSLMRFLRIMNVANPGRFLMPLPINDDVISALRNWKRRWAKAIREDGQ